MPKGGGAIRGIGEKFSTNLATGTGSLSIPIATSPGRAGFELGLTLSYDSGAGNGPFGIGWHLPTPSVTRKTDKGLPRYLEGEDSDVFVLSGAEDLVPVSVQSGAATRLDGFEQGGYRVQRYRPRTEGLFARIERWTDKATGEVHWRATTRDNVLSIYGRSPLARIADPEYPGRVFSWLLEETHDDQGNLARYTYKPEDGAGVVPGQGSESSRFESRANGPHIFRATAQRYLKRIQYGNRVPVVDRNVPAPTGDDDYLFEVVFDYGEHHEATPTPAEARPWPVRQDAFSSYRATFEVRTYRLCRRVLMFHRFAELGPTPCMVRSTDFTYDEGLIFTYLAAATQAGYKRAPGGSAYERATLPPLELGYAKPVLHDELRTVDSESLAGLPGGVPGAGAQWVDLDGEGIPGVLVPTEKAWLYKANLGHGHLAPPVPLRMLPAPAELSGGTQQLTDLDGNGQLDLVQYAPPLSGYFERTPEGDWAPFMALRSLPNIDWNDPNLRFLDMDGDGHADVLITEHEAFVWYRSRAKGGFEPAVFVAKPKDELKGPAVVFSDGTETIQLADMSGDGLVDIVRVRNGQVCYWPNLGFGRFGRRVTLDNSPIFDAPERFDPKRIRFADIDGSGTSDIIYLGRDGVRLYFNHSGNALSAPTTLRSLPQVDFLSSLGVVDLLGQGTACLVWSSPLPGNATRPLAYVDLMGGKKPHVLESVVNNLGAETRIAYAPSTKFYLQDKAEGRPWLTRLAFPVHVIERIERYDYVAKSKLVTRFAYHHGYFDGHEREFRGFACVEQWDAESFSGDKGKGLFPELPYDTTPGDEELNLPPVRIVTWFHTGAWLERERLELALAKEYYDKDPQAPLLPDTTLPGGLSIREEREAARALRGQVLRQEVYAEDGTPEAIHPYTVSERDYEVRLLQHAGDKEKAHAVFFVHPRHTLNLHYERKPNDPRMQHEVVLEVDDFGNVTQSAAISYPRRIPAEPEQARLWATVIQHTFANRPDESGWYRIGVPVETIASELTGLSAPSIGILSADEVRAKAAAALEIPYEATATGGGQRRIVERDRRFYYRDDLSGPLPLGQIESLALAFETYRQAFTPGLLANAYGAQVTDAILQSEGRYIQQDGVWWAPSGRTVFDPSRFYFPVEAIDPFGQHHHVRYDAYALLALEAEDPLHNRTTAGLRDIAGNITQNGNDYRVLAPALLCDPNRNRTRVEFDALGMVVRQWQMGREGTTEGDPPDLPGVVLRYDLDAWRRGDGPAFTHVATREVHGASGAPFAQDGAPLDAGFQHARSYSDGFGREVMKKIQAEPGPVPIRGTDGRLVRKADGSLEEHHAEHRWVGTGRTVFDNKGNPIKKYEPFFSGTIDYEDEEVLVESGITPILHYDPLGRLVRTDQPNGTHALAVFDSWKQETWDENDTVLESEWYDRRGRPDPQDPEPRTDPGRRAAWLAARHAHTPSATHLDSLGRTFLTMVDNGRDADGNVRRYSTRVELDVEGNELSITDARGNKSLMQVFDVLGRKIRVVSADGGESRMLLDAGDKPVREWDARGYVIRKTYDVLRRLTHTFVRKDGGPEELVVRTVYGEGHPDAEARSLRGHDYQTYDGAGVLTSERFDFKGNPGVVSRRVALEVRQCPDWSPLFGLTNVEAIEDAANALLEPERFTATATFDAMNRLVSRMTPDGSETLPTYNRAGLLESIRVRIRGAAAPTTFVEDIGYNARGQREFIRYGNGTTTRYQYDDETFRLVRQITTRAEGNALQDLMHTHDPTGNIVAIRDAVSYGNEGVPADGLYEYDALYRLSRAEGREHSGLQPTHADAAQLELPPGAHPNDWHALRRFRETYIYDPVGNVLEMSHQQTAPGPGGWTRRYQYANDSNHLIGTSVPGDISGSFSAKYEHDAVGNMTQMPHLQEVNWDYANRLQHVKKQDQDAGGPANDVYFAYDISGRRVRKVYEHSGLVEERIYLGGYEIYRRRSASAGAIQLERQSLHVMDDKKRIALVETKTIDRSIPAFEPSTRLRFQLDNHLGSSTMEIDGTGGVISYEEYRPYGSAAFRAADSGVDVSARTYRYTGKERDEETGLCYYGARYYACWLGRWISPDPLGFVDGPCLYAYSRNNPVVFTDQDGKQAGPWDPLIRMQRFQNAVNDATDSLVKSVTSVAEEVVKGDFHEGETTWAGVGGNVGVGLIPIVGQIADARDTVANAKKVWDNPTSGWAWGGLGMAVVGWVPLLGDGLKGAGKVGKKVGKEVLGAETKVATEVLEKEAKAAKELAEREAKAAKEAAEKTKKAEAATATKTSGGSPDVTRGGSGTPPERVFVGTSKGDVVVTEGGKLSAGLSRELRVAEITGGRVGRAPGSATKDLLVRGGGTGARVDVVGASGELIAVGGPSKVTNLGGVGDNLTRLRTVAKAHGVRALAYFEEGTPSEVIQLAQKLLGAENVHLFPR